MILCNSDGRAQNRNPGASLGVCGSSIRKGTSSSARNLYSWSEDVFHGKNRELIIIFEAKIGKISEVEKMLQNRWFCRHSAPSQLIRKALLWPQQTHHELKYVLNSLPRESFVKAKVGRLP